MSDINSQLQVLQVRLQQLIKSYQQLQKENVQLKKNLAKRETEVATKKDHMQKLQHQLDALKLTKSAFDETERTLLEKRIDIYLREIEKCLALLNSEA
jgi:cell division septum initiation protein DivIVA